MEITIAISIIACVVSVSSFVLSRKDKAVQNEKETNLGLINYRLDELDKNVQKILDKLDSYEREVDEKIEKAIEDHIKLFHRKRRNTNGD